MNNNLYIGFNAIVANHNWSLSLLYRGEIFAIEIERINRIKDFPDLDLARILPGLQKEMFNGLDQNTNNKDYIISIRNYIEDIINDIINKLDINLKKINNIYTLNFPFDVLIRGHEDKIKSYKENNHHTFHAYSTYFPSPFNETVILCMDHDGYDEDLGGINSMHSIWHAKGNNIKHLYSDEFSPKKAQAGIGAVYNNHSNICGIGEGTLMGLSGYGNGNLKNIKIFDYTSGGALLSKIFLSKKSFDGLQDFIDGITKGFREAYKIDGKGNYSNIENSIYADISDKVQTEIEEAVLFLANKAYNLTKCKNICIAGGVGLNIIANNKILLETKFENIFVQPACNDAGLSLGGLYYMYHNILGNSDRIRLVSPGLGFKYSNEKILEYLEKYKNKSDYIKLGDSKYKIVAELLKNDNIIGWFQGKGEFGPRSLGFRSILASPISKNMKTRVNRIKEREQYRPLAPIILENDFKDYLDTNYSSPYMTLVALVLKQKKESIPSVVHVDGTARYQTVNKEQNKYIYMLLKEFKNLTGESVLINTSFNQHDEPIIEDPEGAIKMFLATELNYLVIGDYLVSKEKTYSEFKFNKKIVNKEFNNKLKQSKNNNFRGKTILKLLGIGKLGFNYNYENGDKGIKLTYRGDLEIIIQVKDKNITYNKAYNNVGLLINNGGEKYFKILRIIEIFLEKNSKIIFNLIKGI